MLHHFSKLFALEVGKTDGWNCRVKKNPNAWAAVAELTPDASHRTFYELRKTHSKNDKHAYKWIHLGVDELQMHPSFWQAATLSHVHFAFYWEHIALWRKYLQTRKTSSASGRQSSQKTDANAQVQSSWERFSSLCCPNNNILNNLGSFFLFLFLFFVLILSSCLKLTICFPTMKTPEEEEAAITAPKPDCASIEWALVYITFLEGFYWLLGNKCAFASRRHRPACLLRSVWFLPEEEYTVTTALLHFHSTQPSLFLKTPTPDTFSS